MSDDYYLSSGKKVPLNKDKSHIAIDLNAPEILSLGEDVLDILRKNADFIKRGVALLNKENMPDSVLELLKKVKTKLPVFNEEGTLIVVLPEVRVEIEDESQLKEVMKYIKSGTVTVLKEKHQRLSLAPVSGMGSDALDLANQIGEKLKVGLSQARFLRVIPRKDLK